MGFPAIWASERQAAGAGLLASCLLETQRGMRLRAAGRSGGLAALSGLLYGEIKQHHNHARVFTSLAFVLSYLRIVTCVMDRTLEMVSACINSVKLENGIRNLSWMYGHCISTTNQRQGVLRNAKSLLQS